MSRPPKKFQQFMKKRGNKISNKGLDSKIFFVYIECQEAHISIYEP
jgi:hypothetical protein